MDYDYGALYNGTAVNWTTSDPLQMLTATSDLNDTAFNLTFKPCQDEYDPNQSMFEFYVYGILLNLLGLIGIVGNIVTMVILSRPQMRSSINYLLIGLARCDTVLIIAAILLFGLRSVYQYTGYMFYYHFIIYPNIASFVYPMSAASQTASSYLTLMVSLERYVAVCHPLRARALCTYGRSRYYVAFCVIFALLYNVIKLWESQIFSFQSPRLGLIYCITPSRLRVDPVYITVYIHWCYLIVNYFVPFTGLVVFNALIFRQVRRANRERQRLSRSEKREIGLATMLLAVVIVFFALNVLALYVNLCEAFFQHIDDDMIVMTNFCVTFNSCVNFVIYVIFGEKFKRLFVALFCKCLQDAPDGLIHDDSSFSNGGGEGGGGGRAGDGSIRRGSSRLTRHGAARCSRNGVNTTVTSLGASLKVQRSIRVRAPSPAPCVYYPAREIQRTISGYDWDGVTVTVGGAKSSAAAVGGIVGNGSVGNVNNNGTFVATTGF